MAACETENSLTPSRYKLPYENRLISFKLHTLKYRRLCGDMIEVVKIVNGIYDEKVAPTLHFNKSSVTRGNKFKLHNQTFIHNFRKHFFSARIVNIWNSLPNYCSSCLSVECS